VTPQKNKPAGKTRASRSAARLGAVQALYQMDMVGTPLDDIVEEFALHRLGREMDEEADYLPAHEAHFEDVVRGVVREQRAIDQRIHGNLAEGWKLERIDSTLRAILRSGVYELQRCKDVPVKVVITEYVDIAHAFFDGDEPKVVNALLDKLGRELRADEFRSNAGANGRTG
jgi:N utilization substance protein B